MNRTASIKFSLITAALLAMPLAQAATMSKPDYQTGKARISDAYKADKTACAAVAGNAKDICMEEAKGREKVAKAELEYGYTGKDGDHKKLLLARADAAYAVAKEKCDDLNGNAKDVCIKEAKAVSVKAKADAKLSHTVADARTEAAGDKKDADYKVATEKCESLAGDAKAACLTAAKARFGKS